MGENKRSRGKEIKGSNIERGEWEYVDWERELERVGMRDIERQILSAHMKIA